MTIPEWLFDTTGLTPHGFCLTWSPGLLWLDAISDGLTMLAYFSIPLALLWFVSRRRDLPHRWLALLFVAFILACGTTHGMDVLTLWVPAYPIEGVVKAVTAVLSLATAVALWPLVPRLLAVPSATRVAALNEELRRIIAAQSATAARLTDSEQQLHAAQDVLRRANDDLEQRVADRTAELVRANGRLARNEARFRQVVEAAPNAMVMVSTTGRIEMVNAQAERMFGYMRAELLGQPVERLLPLRLRDQHPALRTQFLTEPQSRPMGERQVLFGLRKDGREFEVEIGLNPMETEDGLMVLAAVVDISDRVRLEAELRQSHDHATLLQAGTIAQLHQQAAELAARNATIDLLAKLAHRLPCCVSLTEFALVVECFAPQILPQVAGALCVVSHSGSVLNRIAKWGESSCTGEHFVPAECWALRRGQAHQVADTSTDMLCQHVAPTVSTAHCCLPLVAQGTTVGLLYLECTVDPGNQDIKMLTETIALALVNLRLRETLRNQSIRDHLTGLFNRRYLEEALEIEIARALRAATPFAVMILDVDHFKQFNDTFGHDAGDAVLREIGTLLTRQIRKGDIACRYGGEEFAMVLSGAGAEAAAARAEAIRRATQSLAVMYRGRPLGQVTASLGVCVFAGGDETPRDLLSVADDALYAAKRGGRNRIHVASQDAADTPPAPRLPELHIPAVVGEGAEAQDCHIVDLWHGDITIDRALELDVGGHILLTVGTTIIRARVASKSLGFSRLATLDDAAQYELMELRQRFIAGGVAAAAV